MDDDDNDGFVHQNGANDYDDDLNVMNDDEEVKNDGDDGMSSTDDEKDLYENCVPENNALQELEAES